MRKVVAVSDEDYTLEIVLQGRPSFIECVTDLFTVWDEATNRIPNAPLQEKYEAWRQALNIRWGGQLSKASAFAVLEAVVTQIKALKKTISEEPNSKLSALIQQEKRTTS